ncbi:MAG TPA: hypothetical protein VFH47_07400 [Candidatus Thermoplasmatota archaeon]|nr:hypothetical protein [Candidatus Thermoplasmatota archaeon]
MGVNLRELFLPHPVNEGWLEGRRVAVDGHNLAYRYLTSARAPDGDLLRNAAGRPIAHLLGFLGLVRHLRERGAEPIIVWDGAVHARKLATVQERVATWRKAQEKVDDLQRRLAHATAIGPAAYARAARLRHEALAGPLVALDARPDAPPQPEHGRDAGGAGLPRTQQVTLASSPDPSLPPPEAASPDEVAHARAELERILVLGEAAYGARCIQELRVELVEARRRVTSFDEPMREDCTRLLSSVGVAVVQADHDGERYAAGLCAAGHADAVATEDFDALVAGAPVMLRKLGSREAFEHRLGDAGLSPSQLRQVAILCGTDWHPGVKGFGAKTARKALERYPDLRTLVAEADAGVQGRWHDLVRASGMDLALFEDLEAFIAHLPATPEPPRAKPDPAAAVALADTFGVGRARVLGCFS